MKKMILVGAILIAAGLTACDKKEEKKPVPVPTPTPVPAMELVWVFDQPHAVAPCGPGPKGKCEKEGESGYGHEGTEGASFTCNTYKCKLMPVK